MSNKDRIYLDYSATTPVDPKVLDAMLPYFTDVFGNAASRNHSYGWEAEEAVENARQQIADLIGASAKEIIFTSGSTEANNMALLGITEMYHEKGNHIITCLTEHKAILDPAHYLETKGFEVTYLEVDKDGMIDLEKLQESITDKTVLISLIGILHPVKEIGKMAANNEIGILHPVKEIGKIAHEKNVFFHTDATQAVGKIQIDCRRNEYRPAFFIRT